MNCSRYKLNIIIFLDGIPVASPIRDLKWNILIGWMTELNRLLIEDPTCRYHLKFK